MSNLTLMNVRNWLANPLVKLVLRSPLHWLLSRTFLLLTLTGRKSGRRYTTPVSYVRDGDTLLLLSRPERMWWRNLRGGAPVTVLVGGKSLHGYAESVEDAHGVAAGLGVLLREVPALRKHAIPLDTGEGFEHAEATTQLARSSVLVRVSRLQSNGS